ncbi:MAG: hypothetical protein AAFS07_18940 [Pseudomonadota bacterium]
MENLSAFARSVVRAPSLSWLRATPTLAEYDTGEAVVGTEAVLSALRAATGHSAPPPPQLPPGMGGARGAPVAAGLLRMDASGAAAASPSAHAGLYAPGFHSATAATPR